MPRTREFDIEQAVEDAMGVFWQHSYDGASLNALLDGLGIARGSFYKAFGTKKDLFCEALQRYERLEVIPMAEALAAPELPGRERVEAVFSKVLARAEAGDRRGCLLCTSAVEQIGDPDVQRLIEGMFGKISRGFRIAIAEEGRRAIQSRPRTKVSSAADALAVFYTGLQGLVRSGMPVERLRLAVEAEISSLFSSL